VLDEPANLVEPTGQLRPNLRGRAVKGAPLANSLHGRFRPDPLDSRVEIGTHKDRDVDELLAGQAQVAQVLLQVEDLRRDRPGAAGAGEELARCDREGPHKARRSEEKGIIVLRTRGPHATLARQNGA